jgi:hypothetical protein
MGAAAFVEPTEEHGDFFTGVFGSLLAKADNGNLVHRNDSFLGTNRREWRLLSRCANNIGITLVAVPTSECFAPPEALEICWSSLD